MCKIKVDAAEIRATLIHLAANFVRTLRAQRYALIASLNDKQCGEDCFPYLTVRLELCIRQRVNDGKT